MKKYVIILFAISLSACELVVDIDVPFERKQMTINSIFCSDSLWRASISLNRFILDDSPFQRVTNATVIISDESGPIDTLEHEGNGVYRSDSSRPSPNKMYTITAISEVYGTAHASAIAPPAALVSNVEIKSSNIDTEPSSRISLTISDDPTIENFYSIRVEIGSEYLNPQTYEIINNRYPAILGKEDDGIQQQEQIINDNALLIKDVFYSGPEINVTVHSPDWNLPHSGKVWVTAKTISKDYYDFILTSNLQNETSGNPFAQPVQVFSNVQNGFGIFAGYSSSTFERISPRPRIISLSSNSGSPGTQIVVNAENIVRSYGSNTALIFEGTFNGVEQAVYSTPLSMPDNVMTFIIPQDAKTGRLWIQSGGLITEWPGGFTVTN